MQNMYFYSTLARKQFLVWYILSLCIFMRGYPSPCPSKKFFILCPCVDKGWLDIAHTHLGFLQIEDQITDKLISSHSLRYALGIGSVGGQKKGGCVIDFGIDRKGVGVIDQCLIRTSNVSRIV